MSTVNYLRDINCKHNLKNINESYRKEHKNDKMKHRKVCLYTSQLKYTSKDDK